MILNKKLLSTGIISCLIHSIFVVEVANFAIPHIARENGPIEIKIIEIPTTKNSVREPISIPEPDNKPDVLNDRDCDKYYATLNPKKENEKAPLRQGTVFLLDASESMVIGLNTAKEILIDRLNRLSKGDLVNIAFFSNDIIFFSSDFFYLEGDRLKEAVAFCQDVTSQGNLDIVMGLEEVLKKRPSKVVIFSDGLARRKDDVWEIIKKAGKEGVIIDTVLIKRKPFDEDMLKKAAYLTGGKFFVAERKDYR